MWIFCIYSFKNSVIVRWYKKNKTKIYERNKKIPAIQASTCPNWKFQPNKTKIYKRNKKIPWHFGNYMPKQLDQFYPTCYFVQFFGSCKLFTRTFYSRNFSIKVSFWYSNINFFHRHNNHDMIYQLRVIGPAKPTFSTMMQYLSNEKVPRFNLVIVGLLIRF